MKEFAKRYLWMSLGQLLLNSIFLFLAFITIKKTLGGSIVGVLIAFILLPMFGLIGKKED